MTADELARGGIVVDDENAIGSCCAAGFGRTPCQALGAAWQADREDRALVRLAHHRDLAAHHARQLAGDGEAEAGSPEALGGRGIGLAELLEQFRLLLGRHADAGVRYGELDPVASVQHLSRPQRDLALFGELAGIAQQIEQDLPQPHGVHCQRAEVVLGLDDKTVLALLGELSRGSDKRRC
jgi:hypothetical protein